MKKYPVVTLCGSTRFKEEFERAQKALTLQGYIVISVGMFGHSGDNEVWEGKDDGTLTKTKMMLDDMHKSKIDMSDEIFVVNPGGYIGESTWSEICYTRMLGKPIQALEPLNESKIDAMVKLHIDEAERLAWEQLDGARHEHYVWYDTYPQDIEYIDGAYVGFWSKNQLILDPWISEDAHVNGSPWADHSNPDEAVEPFKYYGKKKMARFVENILLYRGCSHELYV